eukprot:1161451-Pelagomonas_calceolata.AAC.2
MHIPCRNQVGDWANALEMYVRQQQQQAAWQPTPEGLNAFRAGRASGFADGYKAGALASTSKPFKQLQMGCMGVPACSCRGAAVVPVAKQPASL